MINLTPNTHIFYPQSFTRFTAKIEGAPTLDLGDGKARREFMYAPDLADAVLRAANYIETCPQLINISLGHDFTINEYYSEVADAIDWQGNFTHDLSRPVGMNQKLCDVRRATEWARSNFLQVGIEKHTGFIAKGLVNDTQISACNLADLPNMMLSIE